MFGFYDTYLEMGAHPIDDATKLKIEKEIPDIDNFIERFNAEQKALSIKEVGQEFNSVLMNNNGGMLRNMSIEYPLGRNTGKIGAMLARHVTVVDKEGRKIDAETLKQHRADLAEAEREMDS